MTAFARIVDGGRIILPAEIRRAMNLQKGDMVALDLDGDELRVRSTRATVKRIQEKYRAREGERSMVDELIEERRREARMEDEGR
jgi:AbrB family looped-hinge helix DNA binding protein